jgi:PAS domain S-box-containing protein
MNTENRNNSFFNCFETLFDKTKNNCILLMNEEGIVIAVNAAFTTSFGYSESDIIGKNASILYTKEDIQNGLFENELKKVLSEGESSDNNYLVNKDESLTWVSGESVKVKNSEGKDTILKLIQNIHIRKNAEIALRRLHDFNENILGSIEDVVIVIDNQLNLVKANNAFINLFKKEVPDMQTLNIGELIDPYDEQHFLVNAIKNTIKTKKGFSNKQIEMEIPSGEKRFFDVSCTPLQNVGEDNLLLIVHDITIHKQLEREREDIMGFVAHELRNPLANVILCNEVMSEAIHDNEIDVLADMLERNKNNVTRLQKMITELYEATRINSGYLQLEVSTFNFGEMVNEAILTIEVLQPSFNIVLKDDTNFEITADRHRLIQVITNYLSNGIKYSNGKTEVSLSVIHDEKSVTVSVKDEGLGISKEQLPYVFERFFRVEKTRNIEGIGLGLYLCHQIIHAHKGIVWAESEEGKGSTFYFSIPLNFQLL